MVTMFVGLLLWGFIAGDEGLKFSSAPTGLKWFFGLSIVIALFFGVLWAAGVKWDVFQNFIDFLFYSAWSTNFWTNVVFVVVVIGSLVLVLTNKKG